MKNSYIKSTEYSIKPRIKKYWFKKDILVYDLIQHTKEERWCDTSYGNGGGNFIEYSTDVVMFSFNNKEFAEDMLEIFKNKV